MADLRVVVAIPTTGTLGSQLFRYLWPLAGDPSVRVALVQHKAAGFVEDVRQMVVDAFLANYGCPWLLMLDSDTVPRLSPVQIVDGAEAAGVKLTLGPTPFQPFRSQVSGIGANIFQPTGPGGRLETVPWHQVPWSQPERFLPIQSGGFACSLLHRSVLEHLMSEAKRGKMAYPFKADWREGRMIWSEDIMFWARARKLGYQLYADLDNACAHSKHFNLTPQHAIDDLAFHSPGEAPNPDAPRGWRDGDPMPVDVTPVRLPEVENANPPVDEPVH